MLETHTHNQTQGPRRLSKALLLPRLFHPLFGIRLDSNMFQFAKYTNVSRPNVDDFSIYPMVFTMSYHNFPSCTIIIINYPMILPSVSSSVYPIISPALPAAQQLQVLDFPEIRECTGKLVKLAVPRVGRFGRFSGRRCAVQSPFLGLTNMIIIWSQVLWLYGL